MINHYWFEPLTKTFYGPNTYAHYAISLPEEVIDILVENCGSMDTLYDVQLKMNWARVSYNTENKEFSLNTNHNKTAILCTKEFVKQGRGEIRSLFLDIKNQCTLTRLEGKKMTAYLKTGKIKLDQFE